MKITFTIYLHRPWPFSVFQKWGWLKERKMKITGGDSGIIVDSNCNLMLKKPPIIILEDLLPTFLEKITFYPKPTEE